MSRVSRQDNITVGCNPSSLLAPTTAQAALSDSADAADSYMCIASDEPAPDSSVKHLAPFCTALAETQSLQSLAASVKSRLTEVLPYANTPLKVRLRIGWQAGATFAGATFGGISGTSSCRKLAGHIVKIACGLAVE